MIVSVYPRWLVTPVKKRKKKKKDYVSLVKMYKHFYRNNSRLSSLLIFDDTKVCFSVCMHI